ncbi:MAG: BREX system P-loop protein BrxC [Victivallales bacterium]|nr:BREX system P-loop protein BrxC [Victivallales bacterium]
MKIKGLFLKPIDRNIEGVIKASDDEHIFDEVYEYVITNEIASKLSDFFQAYNNYHGANGVWISGFFGSGKSHLLKMLSYLLENKTLDSALPVSDVFLEKPNVIDDPLLKADIQKAVKIPSKSILFNIDEKAVVISKTQVDAVLSVFLQVFNEMMGYNPKADYLAEFERQLDNDGKYEKFQKLYYEKTGKPWEKDRIRVHTRKNQIFAQVLSEIDNISYEEALKTLDRYKDSFSVSIDNFTDIIKEYIDKQDKGFRLNFFVDEVGQYIADNVKLMTNLQTIAESLAVKCKGQAWIFVTSQQDMQAIIGDMSSAQGNDFSKIKDRFSNTISLNSADVAEVIKKRLLAKKEEVIPDLSSIYEVEKNNFRTIFEFNENSRRYKLFTGKEDFYYSYPFIPYQFELFQSSIMGISKNNGFEGHYRSVGERSMLSVFQDVTKSISDSELGTISTFDLMFDGIKHSLKSEIQNSILQAARSDLSLFTLKVLKAMFLVKFVKEFKPTVKNISILLQDKFRMNIAEHEKTVKEVLNELEAQSYIQRNGNLYEYLTDKEKSIENEIKNTETDSGDINKFMVEAIFKNTIRDNKIVFEANKESYEFSKKYNDIISGRESDLSINIITGEHEARDSKEMLSAKSMKKGEMIVVLKDEKAFTDEIRKYLQTKKYIKINHSSTLTDEEYKLLGLKGQQNLEREQRLTEKVASLISESDIYINGTFTDIQATDPKTKIYKAFQELVKAAYPNIKMLKRAYKLTDINRILTQSNDDLLLEKNDTITEAGNEIINFITGNRLSAERTTIKSIISHFTSNTYGWPLIAVQCILAELYLKNKIECKQDSTSLDKNSFSRNLQNSSFFANTVVDLQEEFNERQVKKLKEFYLEVFHEPNSGKDAKEVASNLKDKLSYKIQELDDILSQKKTYPFLEKLERERNKLKKICDRDYKYFLKSLGDFEDDVLDAFEDVIDPILGFMKGNQREAYDEIQKFIGQNRSNFTYINDNSLTESVLNVMDEPSPYKSGFIRSAHETYKAVNKKLNNEIEKQKLDAEKQILSIINRIEETDEYSKLTDKQKIEIKKPFERQMEKLHGEKLIDVIKNSCTYCCTDLYQNQLALLHQLTKPKPVQPEIVDGKEKPETPPAKTTEFIQSSKIRVHYNKTHLSTVEDVEEYINRLKQQYIEAVNQGKNIII